MEAGESEVQDHPQKFKIKKFSYTEVQIQSGLHRPRWKEGGRKKESGERIKMNLDSRILSTGEKLGRGRTVLWDPLSVLRKA